MIYLKFGNIEGSATDGKYTGWIPLDDVSFGCGVMCGMVTGDGGNRTGANVNFQEVSISKQIDKSTPELLHYAIQRGKTVEAKIAFTTAGGDSQGSSQPYMEYTLQDCVISSYNAGASGHDGDTGRESITISYLHFHSDFYETSGDNATILPIKVDYDIALGQAVPR